MYVWHDYLKKAKLNIFFLFLRAEQPRSGQQLNFFADLFFVKSDFINYLRILDHSVFTVGQKFKKSPDQKTFTDFFGYSHMRILNTFENIAYDFLV